MGCGIMMEGILTNHFSRYVISGKELQPEIYIQGLPLLG
jgi:hypothetical protein